MTGTISKLIIDMEREREGKKKEGAKNKRDEEAEQRDMGRRK